MEVKERPVLLKLEAAKRCPDFDNDCEKIVDPMQCWAGGLRFFDGFIIETEQAVGYCPYLMGLMGKDDG